MGGNPAPAVTCPREPPSPGEVRSIVLFVAGRRGFFKKPACINCSVDEFCACEGANEIFDVDRVLEQKLVDVGEGVMMSEPVRVERGLIGGDFVFASLSHQGILAVQAHNGGPILQFTDLNTGEQVEMEVEGWTLAGFYDDKVLLLTYHKPLRETTVERVFNEPNITTFGEIEGTGHADPWTDVSLLNERRVLYYPTMDYRLGIFNVDNRTNSEIDIGRKVWGIASFAGVGCGVGDVFHSHDDNCTYILNEDDTVTKVDERQYSLLNTVFLLTSSPRNIKNALFKYGNYLMEREKKIDTKGLIEFVSGFSVIRVYRDIFLAYDKSTKPWVLIRIAVS